MRFQFQLEGLLHVRRLLEQQARERLDESMLRIRALEQNLAEAAEWIRQTARSSVCRKPLPACELHFVETVLGRTHEAIRQCELRKQAEERRASELRAAYLQARRERKTVSTLRDNALRQFQIESSRREQSALDELFLGKLLRSRNIAQTSGAPVDSSGNPKQNP
jgi:flagellar export protein FliJ